MDNMELHGRISMGIAHAWMLSMALSACSQERISGGNSSETPNTLAGRIVDATGAVGAGDTVWIRPAEWTSDDIAGSGPDKSWQTIADSQGRYRFEGVPSGTYVIESKGPRGGFLSGDISVGAGRPLADLGTDTAFALQEVAGRVIADTSQIDSAARVHLCGTDHSVPIDESGVFRFSRLPSGKVRLMAVLGRAAGFARAKDEFRLAKEGLIAPRLLAPTKFDDEDYSRWPRVKKARMRFTSAGWHLASDVPMAPIRVRLDASILPGPWEPNGSSLRFTDSVGTKLAYEIESWDPIGRRAEIWVRLVQADKGSDRHSLLMYWGRADAPSRSDGSMVFDTAQGWVGVWHLRSSDPWKDATANRLRLAPTGIVSSRGLIGDGVVLHPGSRLVAQGDVLQGWQDATASLWARVDSMRTGSVLARLGDADAVDSSSWVLGMSDSAGAVSATYRTSNSLRGRWSGIRSPMAIGRWTSLAGVFTRGTPRVRLIVDDSAQSINWKDSIVVRAKPDVFVVGGGFTGWVDEIRLRRVGAHPDALRMQWGADRENSPVLEWLP
jgi:hypothetical protein